MLACGIIREENFERTGDFSVTEKVKSA